MSPYQSAVFSASSSMIRLWELGSNSLNFQYFGLTVKRAFFNGRLKHKKHRCPSISSHVLLDITMPMEVCDKMYFSSHYGRKICNNAEKCRLMWCFLGLVFSSTILDVCIARQLFEQFYKNEAKRKILLLWDETVLETWNSHTWYCKLAKDWLYDHRGLENFVRLLFRASWNLSYALFLLHPRKCDSKNSTISCDYSE